MLVLKDFQMDDVFYWIIIGIQAISTEVTAVASSLCWCCTRVHAAYDKLQLPSNIFIFLC